jgi:hypothetical protein
MAERLAGHQWHDRRNKYPWDEWLDGSTWQLTPGEDYTNVNGFRRTVYEAAEKRGGHARTSMVNGHLLLQFTPGGKP